MKPAPPVTRIFFGLYVGVVPLPVVSRAAPLANAGTGPASDPEADMAALVDIISLFDSLTADTQTAVLILPQLDAIVFSADVL